jgi:hypothetical protein
MNHIKDEHERLSVALASGLSPMLTSHLYAAKQALKWAQQPESFKSPFDMIMGTRPNSVDCSEDIRRPL